jgi:hypothetical protein
LVIEPVSEKAFVGVSWPSRAEARCEEVMAGPTGLPGLRVR